jgi:hypothetical protein
MEGRRKDAIMQERLTSSPFVMSIYGHCGTSVIAPLATSGSLDDCIHSVRNGGKELSAREKLKVAIHLAEGLDAVHGGGNAKSRLMSSFVHNDLDVSQYVFRNGLFQINDFNHGKFMYLNTTAETTNETTACFMNPGMIACKYSAPEAIELFLCNKTDEQQQQQQQNLHHQSTKTKTIFQ